MLQQVISFVNTQWPKRVDGDLKQLHQRRASLAVVNRCLMFADRVIIPPPLRNRILKLFHSSHPGISHMKSIARSYVYWPSMDTDIEKLVKSYRNCQQASKNPPKQEPVPWPQTNSPWTRVHIDFAGPINGVTYLIVIDSYSKRPEVISLMSATTTATIAALRRIFSQHGLPEIVVSDNGTQYSSAQFNDFCQQHCIKHIFSPPYHPQSSGQAERFVDTFKHALLKARGEGTSEEVIQHFLFAYRTTTHKALSNHLSPAEALMGRKLRSVHHALLPINESTEEASPTTGYSIGTNVYTRDYRPGHNRWIEGVVTGRHGKVIYDVSVAGEVWIRHRNQLRQRTGTNNSETNSLPFDILMDTFEISTQSIPAECNDPPIAADQTLLPLRLTHRKCQSTRHLHIDTKRKHYQRT